MSEHPDGGDAPTDPKGRILAAALDLFTRRGYRATSMREVAEQVGLSKATLYHHYRSKSQIIRGLLLPLLDQLDEGLAQAPVDGDLAATRTRILTGCVDTMLAHRAVLTLLLRDTSVYTDEVEIADRTMAWMQRAIDLLSGPEAGQAGQIHAAQAVAAIADPLTLGMPVPDSVLRPELLRGARLLLGSDAG